MFGRFSFHLLNFYARATMSIETLSEMHSHVSKFFFVVQTKAFYFREKAKMECFKSLLEILFGEVIFFKMKKNIFYQF